jgi:small GTP-binding protein
MVKKKICLLGCYGVGKTSLASRFVSSLFNEKYLTTVGVKVDKKMLQIDGVDLTLMVWDLAGEEENLPIKLSYVNDASGYLLVIDGTRGKTLDVALSIQERVLTNIGDLPFVTVINKADQRGNWEIRPSQLDELSARGWTTLHTSAKTGENVEESFLALARLILEAENQDADDGLAELV